jgi:short-subunit dehydrogenase
MTAPPATPRAAPRAVVFGAGPGLGRSLALRLAAAGFDLVLLARDEQRLGGLAEEVAATGRAASTRSCDAADPHAVAAVVAEVAGDGELGVLAYIAAAAGGRLVDASVDALRRATDVNLHSPVAAGRAALPALERAGGAVLLTGGGLALHPAAAAGVLSVGTTALRTAALLLADDLAGRGVRVRTLTVAGGIAPGGPFDPDHVADAFWALATDPAGDVERVFTGAPLAAGRS